MESRREMVAREGDNKPELTEKEKENIIFLDKAVEELWRSMYGNASEGSIKDINTKILTEQKREPINESLIDGYKAELMGAYVPHRNELLKFVFNNVPPKLNAELIKQGIILKNLPGDMFQSVADLMTQDLTSDVSKNRFKLAEWIEKVNHVKLAIKKYL